VQEAEAAAAAAGRGRKCGCTGNTDLNVLLAGVAVLH
jgi:hypothetical protein